jgi:hypothetical protein
MVRMIGLGVDQRPPVPAAGFAAILRHERPDGSVHFDLLLGPATMPGVDERSVATWRCRRDPMTLDHDADTPIKALPLHRGLYLSLDHAVTLSDDRGTVTPVWRGTHRLEVAQLQLIDHGGRTTSFEMGSALLRRLK